MPACTTDKARLRSYLREKLSLLVLLALGLAPLAWAGEATIKKPETRRSDVKDVLHGVEVPDPYRWLEESQSPQTRAWIEAQNKYTQALLGDLAGREALKQRLTELMRIDIIGTPRVRDGRYFFFKRGAHQDISVLYLRQGLEGEDEVLIDPHPMSPDHTTTVTLLDVSQDGGTVVYGVREGGEDEIAVKLLDVETRKNLPDQLPKARYFGAYLKRDKSGLYYTRHTEDGPRVYYHALGTDPGDDRFVFGEGYDKSKIILAQLSHDRRYLIIHVLHGSAADKTEIYYQDLAASTPIQPIVNDIPARFFGVAGGEQLFVQTNWKAPKDRVLAVDLKNPARENWREIIPEQGDAVIDGFSVAGGHLFVNYLHNVRSVAKIFTATGAHVRDIPLPGLGSVSNVSGLWDSKEVFYSFTSFHMPTTIYRYAVDTGRQDVWAKRDIPIDSGQFAVRQVWYESKDGTLVPMFLVHRKGIRLDGSNPTLLTGYGGFTLSLDPFFSSTAVVWVEHGGVFAVPNLRGGGEFGEEWHRAGRRENKQNVFDDFIAAAAWLIENGYTNPSKLAVRGSSNGGLLVGAALTQRPDLFRAVVCSYPLLDMLRYHKFLVARFWVPEYGSADDPEQFRYLHAYSPYHNAVKGTEYPAVLFISGDADTRVDPLHARKMTALLQWATGSDQPVLLKYDIKSGHSGGRPLSKEIEDSTDSLSFLLWQLQVPVEEGID